MLLDRDDACVLWKSYGQLCLKKTKKVKLKNKYGIAASKTKVKISITVSLFGLEASSTLDSPEEACRLTMPLVSNSETC